MSFGVPRSTKKAARQTLAARPGPLPRNARRAGRLGHQRRHRRLRAVGAVAAGLAPPPGLPAEQNRKKKRSDARKRGRTVHPFCRFTGGLNSKRPKGLRPHKRPAMLPQTWTYFLGTLNNRTTECLFNPKNRSNDHPVSTWPHASLFKSTTRKSQHTGAAPGYFSQWTL